MIRPRRSIRLKGYGYAQLGAYFVTVCTRVILFNPFSIFYFPFSLLVRLSPERGRMENGE
jgi:hypothetical protein